MDCILVKIILTVIKNGYKDGNQQLQYVSKERTVVDYLAGCDDKYIQTMYETYLDVEKNQ